MSIMHEKSIRKEVRKRLAEHRVIETYKMDVKCHCDKIWRGPADHATHVSQGVGDLVVKLVRDALVTKPPRTTI